MKKILSILIVSIMAISLIIPTVSADPPRFGYDDEYPGGKTPQNATAEGKITYTIGSGGNPADIAAIWETVDDDPTKTLDDDETKDGCQVNPPMRFNQYRDVWVYIAIYDPDGDITDNSDIKIDISWPDNELTERLGLSGWAVENLHPSNATKAEFDAAHAIDGAPNDYFICYYNGFDYDLISDEYSQENIVFKKVQWNIFYHWPAGWYDANVTIQGSNTFQQRTNYFEYALGLGIEIDFDSIDWGQKNDNGQWYKKDGNWVWDNIANDPDYPTIRAIGNWDNELGIHFTNGSFWWDGTHDDVYFDVRVGNSLPGDPKYNKSYREEHSLFGLEPCTYYSPLPIDNSHLNSAPPEVNNFNDTLLKCHMAKLDFYLYPKQWSNGPGEYIFDIEIFVDVPDWMPIQRHPCTGVKI
jgi:hypothetical protein